MIAQARVLPQRRGACPGLSAPMPTGDGLLVRLSPIGTIPLAAFIKLCAAARTHGNGIVEITSRGSIQIRGLSAASAPRFAADVVALGLAAEDGIPIICNPLSGLADDDLFDAAALATDLRRALAQRSMVAKLDAKVSVAINAGGALGLAALSADIRLNAEAINGNVGLRVSVAGDEASATDVGLVALANGAEAALRLLDVLAKRGHDMRARDILASEGSAVFRIAVADLLERDAPPRSSPRFSEALGTHPIHSGLYACGIALAFGHADAAALERLVDAAQAAGASGLRAAPGRVLMIIGLPREAAPNLVADAEALGFVVRADDPRRNVVACAGAPICASAHIAARAIAPSIAGVIIGQTIHISGCAKGCAHPAPAALTVVGTPDGCALVTNGSARDAPFAVVATGQLAAAIAHYAHECKREVGHV
jgi:precorrin-3B synthase